MSLKKHKAELFKGKRKLITVPLVAGIFLVFSFSSKVLAHSGRTDVYGCHNCYTSYCYGEYHCHNGGSYSSGYSGGYVAPYVPENPIKNGTWEFTPHPDEPLYDVLVDWADTTQNTYSIVISKTPGGDPGPLVDTRQSQYIFKDVAPGRWYVNVKTSVGGTWSKVAYWTIDVPKWIKPAPTPMPVPTRQPTPAPSSSNESPDDTTWLWLSAAAVGYLLYYTTIKKQKKKQEDKAA